MFNPVSSGHPRMQLWCQSMMARVGWSQWRQWMGILVGLNLVGSWIGFGETIASSATATATTVKSRDPWDLGPAVRSIDIELGTEATASLQQNVRRYVRATVQVEGHKYRDVGLHLKGATGSFRPLQDKPSLTLDFSRFVDGQSYLERRKFHLNNSVEDPSYISELIGSEIFRTAGIPAPQVSHALVTLNGRRLGLYVLKEGFAEALREREPERVAAWIYEPRVGGDVDSPMRPLAGPDLSEARKDPEALVRAVKEPNVELRWAALERVLDLDSFLTFMALEVLVAHRDGYSLARNNFRLYPDPATGRFRFLPQGMDQLFGPENLPWVPQMAGLVARAVMEIPEGRLRYQQRFATLFATQFDPTTITNRIAQLMTQLRPFVEPREFRQLESAALELSRRVVRRGQGLETQLQDFHRPPLEFLDGLARLDGWKKIQEPVAGRMEITDEPSRGPALRVVAGPVTASSWRTEVRLAPGRYRFGGQVRTTGVLPLPFGQNQGARLRVAGEARSSIGLVGESRWTPLEVEFEVVADRPEVALICELRASSGEAWFDQESLRLTRIR